jgi:3-deoxy-7-phosphoheptulonate synthase
MIIQLNPGVTLSEAESIAFAHKFILCRRSDSLLLITPSSLKKLPVNLEKDVKESWVFDDDIQLSSKKFYNRTRPVTIGELEIGGNHNRTIIMGGPCSVESEEQIIQSAELVKSCGLSVLRAGAFKPRTSPYSFQGLGEKGMQLLRKAADGAGLKVISEVKDSTHLEIVAEYADIIQIGAKAMYDQGILRFCSKTVKPVLIKRGFGSTVQEWLQAAEFVLSGGNENVMLCERGIRTFETKSRFTLDLCGVAWVKQHSNLPVILDPSHAMGYAFGVPDLARACVAMGVDGLLIETHPDPPAALSDAAQQLNPEEFRELIASLHPVAAAIGKTIC